MFIKVYRSRVVNVLRGASNVILSTSIHIHQKAKKCYRQKIGPQSPKFGNTLYIMD